MSSDEWLKVKSKAPYHLDSNGLEAQLVDLAGAKSYPFWYWCSEEDREPGDTDEESDLLLPVEIFSKLKERTTYPNCKCYTSKEAALDDFRQAFVAATADGWKP